MSRQGPQAQLTAGACAVRQSVARLRLNHHPCWAVQHTLHVVLPQPLAPHELTLRLRQAAVPLVLWYENIGRFEGKVLRYDNIVPLVGMVLWHDNIEL
jgi:hypothetical protein